MTTRHLTPPVLLQDERRLTLLHEPPALDVLSEVFLQGDDAAANSLEVFSEDNTRKTFF